MIEGLVPKVRKTPSLSLLVKVNTLKYTFLISYHVEAQS
jgi:hypothetical protein